MQLGTFPHGHRGESGREHVEHLLHFVADLKPKSLPDNHMPAGSKLSVENFFDHLGAHLVVARVLITGVVTDLQDLTLHLLLHVGVLHPGQFQCVQHLSVSLRIVCCQH